MVGNSEHDLGRSVYLKGFMKNYIYSILSLIKEMKTESNDSEIKMYLDKMIEIINCVSYKINTREEQI